MAKMQVKPKVRGFICPSAHPKGCETMVKRWIEFVKQQALITSPKRVLVIGSSTGYGLASRIVNTFSGQSQTIGVMFERPAQGKRTASAGWYNTAAFEQLCQQEGLYAKTINGDAFSTSVKEETIALIKKDWGQVDMVVYSLAFHGERTQKQVKFSNQF